jgi:hypothetical protein
MGAAQFHCEAGGHRRPASEITVICKTTDRLQPPKALTESKVITSRLINEYGNGGQSLPAYTETAGDYGS